MSSPFLHPVNVRYLEVDQQGVVFNMWYLAYIDDAMTAFLAANGLHYPDMMASGFDVQVVHAGIDWKGGIRFGQDAAIATRVTHVGTTSFRMAFDVLRGSEAVATAELVYVCVATDGSGKRAIPEPLRRALGNAPTA
jgi:acyl-CoA thioester hydrolase